jgi:hypothetical protein
LFQVKNLEEIVNTEHSDVMDALNAYKSIINDLRHALQTSEKAGIKADEALELVCLSSFIPSVEMI